MNLIHDRFKLGYERYGHGVRIDDDTRAWGTKCDSWREMAIEEILDALIYCGADILRKETLSKINENSDNLVRYCGLCDRFVHINNIKNMTYRTGDVLICVVCEDCDAKDCDAKNCDAKDCDAKDTKNKYTDDNLKIISIIETKGKYKEIDKLWELYHILAN